MKQVLDHSNSPAQIQTLRVGGFSLVELLSAIAVIAVLAALLIPAVGRISASSDNVTCQQNLRSLGVGMTLYTNDHGNNYPYLNSWIVSIAPYLDGEDLGELYYGNNVGCAYCPSFVDEAGGTNVRVENGMATSYSANCWLLTNSRYVSDTERVNYIPEPARTMLLCDGVPYPNGQAALYYMRHLKSQEEGGFVGYWHSGQANFLFVDGHVEGLTEEELATRIYTGTGERLY
jgi:prepilin-type processing-associated H-X9-DG protein/prepilin-type N-terminal cleavage/methylation domain-containing protein